MPDLKTYKRVAVGSVVTVFTIALVGSASAGDVRTDHPELKDFNYIIGTQTFSAAYQFTSKSKLMETAEAILEMGSNIIKTRIRDRDKDLEALLDMPFAYYFFWYRSQSRTWKGGLSDHDKQVEYDSVYAFTKGIIMKSKTENRRGIG